MGWWKPPTPTDFAGIDAFVSCVSLDTELTSSYESVYQIFPSRKSQLVQLVLIEH